MEIKELADSLNKVAADVKSELTSIKSESEKTGAEWNAKMDKMIAEMTAKHDAIQAQTKAAEDRAARLEAVLQRSETKAAKGDNEAKAKFSAFLRDTKSKDDLEIRGMSTDNAADGGFLVYPELADFMVTRAFETSPLRRVARIVNTSRESIEITIDDNEAGARWQGEGVSGGETTTPQVGKLTINTHKLEAEPTQTTEIIQDAYFDVENWLGAKVADRFARAENTAFVSGNGIGQPRGFMTYPTSGTYARDTIEQVNMGSASVLNADGLIGVQAALKEVYQPSAVWMVKRSTYGDILKLKGADNYFFSQTLLKDGQPQLTLLGKPLVFADDLAAVAANALSVVYGDFSVGYTIVDRVGLTVLRDPFTAKGFVKYYTTKRVGGNVTNFEAIKIGRVAA